MDCESEEEYATPKPEKVGREFTELPFFLEWTCPGGEDHPHEVCEDMKLVVKYYNTCGIVFRQELVELINLFHRNLGFLYGRLADNFIGDGEIHDYLRTESAKQYESHKKFLEVFEKGFVETYREVFRKKLKEWQSGE